MIGSLLSSQDKSLGLESLTNRILALEGPKISQKKLRAYFSEHPFPASLHALSHLFAMFEMDHLQLTIDPSNIFEMQFPLVTSLEVQESPPKYILLHKIDKNTASFFDQESFMEIPTEDFMSSWAGNELLLYSTEDGNIPTKFKSNIRDFLDKKLILGISLIILFSIFFLKIPEGSNPLGILLSSLLALGGLFTVLIIALKEAGKSNKWLNRFCKNDQIDTCDLLLHSSYAYIVPGLSWTSLGFVFFSSVLIFLLITPTLTTEVTNILLLYSIFTLPGIGFSLFIQGFLSDYWCRLCLIVQGILLVNLGSLFWIQGFPQWPSVDVFAFGILSFLMGGILWHLFSRQLQKELKSQADQNDLQDLKFTPRIIQTLFARDKSAELPYLTRALQIGPPNAPISLLFISNPACSKCSEAHTELISLYAQYQDKLQLSFLFHLYKAHEEQTDLIQAFQHLHTTDESTFLKGLELWYKDITQPIDKWKENLGTIQPAINKEEPLPIIQDQTLTNLPTIYLNGNLVPTAYYISDLRYILPYLST